MPASLRIRFQELGILVVLENYGTTKLRSPKRNKCTRWVNENIKMQMLLMGMIQEPLEQQQKRKEILNIIRKISFTPQGIKKEGTIVAAHFLLWLYGWWKARG
jgi:hypothetical protein